MIGRLTALVVCVVVLAGCQPAEPTRLTPSASAPGNAAASGAPVPPTSVGPSAVTVFGAASLKGALEQLKAAYESGRPGTTLTISTDSSAALEIQIEQGAPADVFLSADVTNPQHLVDKGLADGAAVDFAGNVLTIVVPTDNPGGLTTPADLSKSGVKVIAAGDDVPITKYATQVVDLLARQPGYPADFAAAYAANVASKEDNVKAVIAKVELGEGDAGIVYATDARASGRVATIAIPPAASVAAVYAGVVVKGSPNLAAAHAFLDWMTGAEAQLILAQLGFTQAAT
jgi:molybdate transport system substrate-binding protein